MNKLKGYRRHVLSAGAPWFTLWALATCTAVSASGQTLHGFTPKERGVVASHQYWNGICRGGTDARVTYEACEVRQAIENVLAKLRICKGRVQDSSAADALYHRCGPGSYRMGNRPLRSD
jgi:hypothetical protein